MRYKLPILISSLPILACASIPQENTLNLNESAHALEFNTAVTATRVRTHYSDDEGKKELIWWYCQAQAESSPKGVILVYLPITEKYPATKFCQTPLAKTLASQGFNSVAMTKGDELMGSDVSFKNDLKTSAAWERALHRRNIIKSGDKIGILALGTATIPAIFSARNNKNHVDFFIFGGGYFDLVAAKIPGSESYIDYLQTIRSEFANGLEDFSISYDFEWLTKNIWIFHCENDTRAPFDQADAFAKALRTAEFQVKWQSLTGCGASIDFSQLSQVLYHFFSS